MFQSFAFISFIVGFVLLTKGESAVALSFLLLCLLLGQVGAIADLGQRIQQLENLDRRVRQIENYLAEHSHSGNSPSQTEGHPEQDK
jgi:hypothetical protein